MKTYELPNNPSFDQICELVESDEITVLTSRGQIVGVIVPDCLNTLGGLDSVRKSIPDDMMGYLVRDINNYLHQQFNFIVEHWDEFAWREFSLGLMASIRGDKS